MNYEVAETEAFRVEEGGVDLRERTTAFALRVVKMFVALLKTDEARVLGKQVLRSGTSGGANYRESCRERLTGLNSSASRRADQFRGYLETGPGFAPASSSGIQVSQSFWRMTGTAWSWQTRIVCPVPPAMGSSGSA